MRVIVVGLGVQGEKRRQVAGKDFVAAVDPVKPAAQYRDIREVPLASFDAALVCIPDHPKIDVLTYLLANGKHVLVEKPLWAVDEASIVQLEQLAQTRRLVCYTAYNHRFEPHFITMKKIIQSGELGRLYHCRLFYGNGTARLVRDSVWRDQGAGVLTDLAPHLLDLMDFWFKQRSDYEVVMARCFENSALDHVILANRHLEPQLELEMTLLSWRNHFTCDIFGENGTAHIRSLCKWGPTQFILRKRVLPSGRPPEESTTLVQADPTWEEEYQYFKSLIEQNSVTHLSRDIWINHQIRKLGTASMRHSVSKAPMVGNTTLPRIGVLGMTHLGLISATAMASKGFQVIGYDADEVLITQLQSQQLPITEPQLDSLLTSNGNKQTFTSVLQDLKTCHVIYIAADVPTTAANVSDLSPIQTLVDRIVPVLNEKTILVILSQVPPGFTRQLSLPKNQLFYQVETLIFGQAMDRALHPERYIIGCHDPKQSLPSAYDALLRTFHCPVLLMRYESAELAKIAINLFLVSSVVTANLLAEISSQIGADWNEIIPTLHWDKRIGPHAYLKPGLGISGGNLERDMNTILQLGERYGANVSVIKEWFDNSHYQKEWVYRRLQEKIFCHCPDPRIALLGLAYKAHTHSIKNAPALQLLKRIANNNVIVHDPVVPSAAVPFVRFGATVAQTVENAEVLIVLTPWPEYFEIEADWLKQKMRGRWIIDPYQVLNHEALEREGFFILTLGKMDHKEHDYV